MNGLESDLQMQHSKNKNKNNHKNKRNVTINKDRIYNFSTKNKTTTIIEDIEKIIGTDCKILLKDAKRTKNNIERQIADNNWEPQYSFVDTFYHQHKDLWTNLCDTLDGAEEMEIDEEILSKLRNNHNRINNLLLESKLLEQTIENEKIKKELDREKEEIDKAHKQSESILNKLESVGSTVISMILSLGIVTALIYAIDRIDIRYVPLFVVCTLWLGLTMLIFNSRWFQYKDKTVENNIWLYVIISVFTLFIIMYTIFLLPDQVTNTCLPSSIFSAEIVQN